MIAYSGWDGDNTRAASRGLRVGFRKNEYPDRFQSGEELRGRPAVL